MKNKNFMVGVFVICGLLLFTAGLFLIGNRHQFFARHVEFYTDFVNLSGIGKGAKVRVAGMDAGEVLDVGVPTSPASRFHIKFRINENLRGLVRTDSVASIETEGVVGDTMVFIHPGSQQAQQAAALTTLPSKEPLELSDLLEQGKGLLTDVDGTVRNVGPRINAALDEVSATVSHIDGTVGNVNDVVIGLKQGRGPAGMLLRDEALASQVRQIVTNAQTATASLNDSASKANSLIADLQSRQLPQQADDTMRSVKRAAANLDSTSQEVRQTVAEMTGPDQQGVSAGVNLRESLSNVNAATGNLADDTEALKHEFFFKGFFKNRGYYNLTHIDPDTYRSDKVFASAANRRVWLQGSDLFERKPDGHEELTQRGMLLINDAFVQLGDAAEQSPIVIEGYFDGGGVADQLAYSRARALLVRTYLQSHFQLDAANLGAVSLKNLPPAGAGRPSWNGVCILLLRRKS